jgi:pimeloyl-ACP methyl ester carboxylesterase
MNAIRLPRLELAVHDQGQGPPILFAHGFPLDHSMWDETIAGLAPSHRCIAPDLAGFGQSQVVGNKTTMQQFADDLADLLDALNLNEPITVCGLSMGGYVAWQFWLRHPARVSSLILCDTRATADTPEAARARHEMAAKALAEGPYPVWENMKTKLFAPSTLQQKPDLVTRFERVAIGNSPQGIAAALRGMAERPDVTPRLGSISVPVLVLVGQHDGISTPDEMRAFADRIPGARFAVIPNAGHLAPAENPAAVVAEITRFLGSD